MYRKPTHTDRYLNFNSYHTLSHRISVIDSLVNRAFQVCDKDSIKEELVYVTQALQLNSYPLKLIKSSIRKIENRIRLGNFSKNGKDNSNRIAIPFYKGVSHKIGRILRNEGLEVVFTPGIKIGNLIGNPKDKIDKMNRPGIYEISCSCNSKYIGETGRSVVDRIKEHKAATKNCKTGTSAIANHVWESDGSHVIDWDNCRILETEDRFWHRKYKESINILKYEGDLMNLDKGFQFSDIWKNACLGTRN